MKPMTDMHPMSGMDPMSGMHPTHLRRLEMKNKVSLKNLPVDCKIQVKSFFLAGFDEEVILRGSICLHFYHVGLA